MSAWVRALLLVAGLGMLASETPPPWDRLWLAVPAATAVSLLLAWRYGPRGALLPAILFVAALALEGVDSLWVWWIPVAALTGAWMGLREEGGGPPSGQRAWMLAPALLLAAGLPWALQYRDLVAGVDAWMRHADQQMLDVLRQLGMVGERLGRVRQTVEENARLRREALPQLLPTFLFVWIAVLVAAGRALSSRAARVLRWPTLSRGRLHEWRLPDAALWTFLAGLALLVADWPAWAPTAWTLLLNTGLGFCVQGIAVVESLLLARGVPPSIIVLTLLFVFTIAMPVFLLTTAAVGVSDVWLDYRRLEPVADGTT